MARCSCGQETVNASGRCNDCWEVSAEQADRERETEGLPVAFQAPSPDLSALAERVADALMTNGFGEKATRLVMVEDHPSGRRDLGGWCRRAVVAGVSKVLAGNPRQEGQ